MECPLVSIIMPTYNRANIINKSINSVISQSYSNWELIVWDDGSTDSTEKYIRSMNEKRIHYYHDSNHGVSYATNMAINKSKGTYLAFLDDDDIWVNNKLEIQSDVMKENSQVDIIFGNFLNVYKSEKNSQSGFEQHSKAMSSLKLSHMPYNHYLIKNGLLESITISNFILPSTVFLRKSRLTDHLYFVEELRNSQDFEFFWRLGLLDFVFGFTHDILAIRNKFHGSLSGTSLRTYKNKIFSLDICNINSKNSNREELTPFINKAYSNAYQNLMIQYSKQGNVYNVFDTFYKSLKYGFRLGALRLLIKGFCLLVLRKLGLELNN